jgi:hypothetical protein
MFIPFLVTPIPPKLKIPADEVFVGKDPWVMFGMDSKYLEYRQKVLDVYKNKQ